MTLPQLLQLLEEQPAGREFVVIFGSEKQNALRQLELSFTTCSASRLTARLMQCCYSFGHDALWRIPEAILGWPLGEMLERSTLVFLRLFVKGAGRSSVFLGLGVF